MMKTVKHRSGRLAEPGRGWKDDRASQVVEFALSVPLLIMLVIGIFDFSNALALKQKLTNAAREGARVAAADPANDLSNPTSPVPASISDAYQVVDNYLILETGNDCGLAGAAAPTQSGLKWTYTSTGPPCPSGTTMTLAINRGCSSVMTAGASTVNLIGTCVTITYPYKWEFNSVATAVGWAASGPTSITVNAGLFNEN
jgi:TadE-like protein